MSNEQESMFLSLIKTLEKESPETKAMFFADPEKDLIKAYQEGVEARNKRLTIDKNPYPHPSDSDIEKYTKHVCWGEGFAHTFFTNLNK